MRTAAIRVRNKATGEYVPLLPATMEVSSTDAVAPLPAVTPAYYASSVARRIAKWRPATGGPNTSVGDGLETRRARSRDAIRNDGTADNAIEKLCSNIVGTGIVPQFNTPSQEFNRELAAAWLEWTDEADADGRLDFYGLQWLALRSMFEGGDVFARHRIRRAADGLSVPYQIQLLESEMVPDAKNENATAEGNRIRMGIEFDAIGRRTAYHFYRQHPFDYGVNVLALSMNTVPVPASEVVQMAIVRRPGEIRGDPWLTRALVKMWDLGIYDDAQLMRQQIAALFAGFIERDAPDIEGDEELLFEGQTDPDVDGLAVAPLEPGAMQELPAGKKVTFSEPPSPGDSYEAFVRAQKRDLAVSVGLLYEQFSGDYSQGNDRTWRAAVNEFRRQIRHLQHHVMVFQFCRPVLARWALMATVARRISPPAGITPAMIARAKWVPQRWEYINPPQDIKADKDEVRAGFISRSEKITERGYDPSQVEAEIREENERADSDGMIFDTDARRTTESGNSQAKAAGFSFPDPRVKPQPVNSEAPPPEE